MRPTALPLPGELLLINGCGCVGIIFFIGAAKSKLSMVQQIIPPSTKQAALTHSLSLLHTYTHEKKEFSRRAEEYNGGTASTHMHKVVRE